MDAGTGDTKSGFSVSTPISKLAVDRQSVFNMQHAARLILQRRLVLTRHNRDTVRLSVDVRRFNYNSPD